LRTTWGAGEDRPTAFVVRLQICDCAKEEDSGLLSRAAQPAAANL